MKKLLLLVVSILFTGLLQAQVNKYATTSGEICFSYALVDDLNNGNVVPRFSYWFNFQEAYNIDFNKTVGMFSGVSIRNIGFITNYNDSLQTTKKYRTYNIGVPLGIKLGDLSSEDGYYFFAGGELEFPFHFKEKTFYNGKKELKYGEWFGNRVNYLQPSVFLGVVLPSKWTIKLKYYFMDYMNTGYDYYVGTLPTHPYANFLKSNIIFISFGRTIKQS